MTMSKNLVVKYDVDTIAKKQHIGDIVIRENNYIKLITYSRASAN